MRKLLPLLLLLAATFASAQSTYTVTANGCGAKNLGYCRLNVTNQDGQAFQLVIDHRYTGGAYIDSLTISYPYPGEVLLQVRGKYDGFVGNPNGTHAAFYGSGSYTSVDGKVNGTFPFYAYWVATCSGRGCAGTVVGWHFQIQSGSQVTTP